ncbi:MAG: IS110 family transposase [Burkholderiales bacterium]|nr:IS110 family transposase [Burkholderiales bacterium]
MNNVPQICVSVDVGCRQHSVAIGLPNGDVLDEFNIHHRPEGFKQFFERIEHHCQQYGHEVAVAMEGYNGYARPLDSLVKVRGYQLYNINNLKLARFKEIFPAAAKNDRIDACKGLELFQLKDHLPLAKDVLQEIMPTPRENDMLKRLSRRRRALVDEKSRLQSDLHAVCPGLLDITKDADNLWFLRFITSVDELTKLSRLRLSSLNKISRIGRKYAALIKAWQPQATFSHEVEWVGAMIIEDAHRILVLKNDIKALELRCKTLMQESQSAKLIDSIPGFAVICASELAGEIGTIDRFASERSLALYLGMANLENSSGKFRGSKAPKHVNKRAKGAMMAAVDKHRKYVPESQRYYEKKRIEGKSHNQAIRALGRQLCRIIFKMLKQNRIYEIRSEINKNT